MFRNAKGKRVKRENEMQIQSDIHCKHTVNSDEQMNIVSITILELVLVNYRWHPKEVKEL